MTDPYSTLGVSKGADEKAIKTAYRKLAKELHPDKNKDNPKATERFSEVTHAYDLLSDKEKRAAFDRGEIDGDGNPRSPFGGGGGGPGGGFSGRGGFGGQPEGVDLGDIFEGLFGGGGGRQAGGGFGGNQQRRSAPPPKGANIAYKHLVAFTDAATLAPQRITLGDGKTVEFKLPNGVTDDQQIRIPGRGQAGPGGMGDAIVTLKIGSHPHFKRDGDNIRLELPISLKEAIEGGKIKVPTVDGAVMLTVAAGADSGVTLRIPGRGFADKSGKRGNQLVTLMIKLPSDKELLNTLRDMLPDDPDIRAGLV